MTVTIHLPINRAVLGAERAANVFMAMRWAAQKLDPGCHILARYEHYERVGWLFEMRDLDTSRRLRACFDAVLAGEPLKGLVP